VAGTKTNEREGTRAVLRYSRISPYKVREVLDLIRNKPVTDAEEILRFSERDAAIIVGKLLHSAIANAENNDEQDREELYVSACFADEATTIKRWRPRARGRATRIRKRTSHITIIVSRLPEQQLARLQARRQAEQAARRARRVAGARRAAPGGRVGRRRRAEEPAAADVAQIEEQEGIVDETAAAVAAAEAEETGEALAGADEERLAEESLAEAEAATPAGPVVAAEEEAGIVDETGPAVAEAEAAEAEAAEKTDAGVTDAGVTDSGVTDADVTDSEPKDPDVKKKDK
jgi:large subunit ribosomal protein L22